jgi:hypothetical protein
MAKYTTEDIRVKYHPIDVMRRLYSRQEKRPDAAELIMNLVYDLCLIGAIPASPLGPASGTLAIRKPKLSLWH